MQPNIWFGCKSRLGCSPRFIWLRSCTSAQFVTGSQSRPNGISTFLRAKLGRSFLSQLATSLKALACIINNLFSGHVIWNYEFVIQSKSIRPEYCVFLGNTSQKKNWFLSGIARKGGGKVLARICLPFFPLCCPLYFDINIMLCDPCRNHCYLVL